MIGDYFYFWKYKITIIYKRPFYKTNLKFPKQIDKTKKSLHVKRALKGEFYTYFGQSLWESTQDYR